MSRSLTPEGRVDIFARAFENVLRTDAEVVRARADDEKRPLLEVLADRHCLRAVDGHLATAVWITERVSGKAGLVVGHVAPESLEHADMVGSLITDFVTLMTEKKQRQASDDATLVDAEVDLAVDLAPLAESSTPKRVDERTTNAADPNGTAAEEDALADERAEAQVERWRPSVVQG